MNDIAMALFFALAAKEVVEATAPGEALNAPREAFVPLVAALLSQGADPPMANAVAVLLATAVSGGVVAETAPDGPLLALPPRSWSVIVVGVLSRGLHPALNPVLIIPFLPHAARDPGLQVVAASGRDTLHLSTGWKLFEDVCTKFARERNRLHGEATASATAAIQEQAAIHVRLAQHMDWGRDRRVALESDVGHARSAGGDKPAKAEV